MGSWVAKTPWQYLGRKSHCWKAHFFKNCFFVKYFRQWLLSLVNMGLHAAIIRLSMVWWVASVTPPLKTPGYAPEHCVVHSFISLDGAHSEVRTRCSEVGSEWLESWNLPLVLRNKNLWSRNSVLGLGQTDKRKMGLVTSNTVLWCVAVYVVSANPGKWKELTTFAKSFKIINFICYL